MIYLPEDFKKDMKVLFDSFSNQKDMELFLGSLGKEIQKGLRLNKDKIGTESEEKEILKEISLDAAERIPWTDDGYYIMDETQPGKHPYHRAGFFYIQEPSAMLPAVLVDAKPGEKILDLCAAPGGKTVKISSDMCGEGLLISNDIDQRRTKALLKNVEMSGCSNTLVTNTSPQVLAEHYLNFFDKIIIDAPCSGEGMFRKDKNAARSWEKYGSSTCVPVQKNLLDCADRMLKPGGRIIYSTCTFNIHENEDVILSFINSNGFYEPVNIRNELKDKADFESISEGVSIKDPRLKYCSRIFPHISNGEGHFCAVLQKKGNSEKIEDVNIYTRDIPEKKEIIQAFRSFAEEVLKRDVTEKILGYMNGYLREYKGYVYTFNIPIYLPEGIHFIKKGLFLGKVKRIRTEYIFEPSHQFLLTMHKGEIKRTVSFAPDSQELVKYLKGETIFIKDINKYSPGIAGISVNGYPIGWGKIDREGRIKNLYPQGWRII